MTDEEYAGALRGLFVLVERSMRPTLAGERRAAAKLAKQQMDEEKAKRNVAAT